MLFSSLVFIFLFLPTLLVFYYLAAPKWKNTLLIIGSLFFHAWGGTGFTVLLLLSIVFNYVIAKKVGEGGPRKKRFFAIGLIGNIAVLVTFKYLNFFIGNVNHLGELFGADHQLIKPLAIILPLGISFFTFHQMSFLWDIYRSNEYGKLKFSHTLLYVSFFPQLIAGPIVRYKDIIGQIIERKHSLELFNSGMRRFCLGLFRKVVIANTCAYIADDIMSKDPSVLTSSAAWLGILAYTLQIYFDFSGYSDMAIGLGRMFGFRFLENFNFPYLARSIKDFWRCWHISLSNWFRDYVYIPLGGNRSSKVKTYTNLFLVFLLTGFWHGASWSFIFWGVFHGAFLILERLGFERILQKMPKPLSWIYTMLVVMIGWVFFRIEHFSEAGKYVLKMFAFNSSAKYSAVNFLDSEKWTILILAVISCSSIFVFIDAKLKKRFAGLSEAYLNTKSYAAIALMLYAVLLLNSGSYNPFIYFRF